VGDGAASGGGGEIGEGGQWSAAPCHMCSISFVYQNDETRRGNVTDGRTRLACLYSGGAICDRYVKGEAHADSHSDRFLCNGIAADFYTWT
jgi:hypothetical protein